MMTKAHTLEVLQRAAAHLLLLAEEAPEQHAREMRQIAARLQAICVSPVFSANISEARRNRPSFS